MQNQLSLTSYIVPLTITQWSIQFGYRLRKINLKTHIHNSTNMKHGKLHWLCFINSSICFSEEFLTKIGKEQMKAVFSEELKWIRNQNSEHNELRLWEFDIEIVRHGNSVRKSISINDTQSTALWKSIIFIYPTEPTTKFSSKSHSIIRISIPYPYIYLWN